jgi:hypothetical protein
MSDGEQFALVALHGGPTVDDGVKLQEILYSR